jgi:hypothetical protein
MVEYLIFLLPILVIGTGVYQKLLRSEESAIAFINSRNKYGSKGHMLRSSYVFLVYLSFIFSSLFTPLGLYWAVLGIALLSGTVAYLIFSDGKIYSPDLMSSEFDSLVLKRKKQAIVSSFIVLLWVMSWWVNS